MYNDEDLEDVFSLIDSMELSGAVDALGAFASSHPELGVDSPLRDISDGYKLMLDYWSRGFKDEHLERVYRDMLWRLYRLAADTVLRHAVAHSPFLASVHNRVRTGGRDWSVQALRTGLEGFVSDLAMLQLEPEPRRTARKRELHRAHQQLMNDVFDYLWTSPQWADATAEAMEELLLSPTVDAMDQQLMLSAVMLGCMNVFDMNKFRVLVQVYRRSADEQVRQRALVGWVLSLRRGGGLARAEQRDILAPLLADGAVRQELVELQIQLLYCVSAEDDNHTIQKEIMPDLLKNNGLSITPNGIEERDGDSIEDILHPEEAESRMERLEQSFRKMIDMQKAGSDIYFGGFSQMKRFPFFDSVSNWFVPFYIDHPAISAIYSQVGESRMVRSIVEHVPFCDSDKYSFVIAFQQVVGKLPPNIKEMLAGSNVAGMEAVGSGERNSAAYVRRIYLQDLYRFFRLFPSRDILYNPFGQEPEDMKYNYLFFANNVFSGTLLEDKFGEVASCLLKRNMRAVLSALLANYSEEGRDYYYYMLTGDQMLHHPQMAAGVFGNTASAFFAKALSLRPDDVKALSGYARALFYCGDYGKAYETYCRLAELKAGNRNYVLDKCVCLVNMERSEEAMADLYRLDYEHPGDRRVGRVLARALMCTGRHDKASKAYSELCASAECEDEDLANRGLNEWLGGDKQVAAACFADYIRRHYGNVGLDECREHFSDDILANECSLLESNGVTSTEHLLMTDLVCEAVLHKMQ